MIKLIAPKHGFMELENNWRYKSLQNLEKIRCDDMANAPTRLVQRCQELRKIPLIEYTVEDLRLMIGQDFGLFYLVPLAIVKLQDNLLAEGDMYEGDLLASVLKINNVFWKENTDLWWQVNQLISDKRDIIASLNISTEKFDT